MLGSVHLYEHAIEKKGRKERTHVIEMCKLGLGRQKGNACHANMGAQV